jgi:NADH:ubiquinone oxidoreductase subunit 4 (subunit M)
MAKGHQPIQDLSLREWVVLVPMAAMCIYMGVYPKLVVNSLQPPVTAINNVFTNPVRSAEAPGSSPAGVSPSKALAERPAQP